LAREPKTHSFGACFAASAYVKLPQDRRDVMIDRLRGQEKPFGDVGIAQTLRHQSEHLDLARGQARGIVQVRSAGAARLPGCPFAAPRCLRSLLHRAYGNLGRLTSLSQGNRGVMD
jgi:hypothetical protein